jgi:peptidoglycan/LPS O-acetylase OafA/YrhL
MANFVDDWIFEISNVYIALMFAVPSFFLMLPIAYLSYRFIETPFLRFRTPYFKHTEPDQINDSTKL